MLKALDVLLGPGLQHVEVTGVGRCWVQDLGVIRIGYEVAVGKEAGYFIDEDEEEDGAYNRALRDAMGKRKRRCGTSADELGAAGKVAAEPGGGDAVPTQLVQQQLMVDTVKCLARVDRRQRRRSLNNMTTNIQHDLLGSPRDIDLRSNFDLDLSRLYFDASWD